MYLHVGGEEVVSLRELVAIVDNETMLKGVTNAEMLRLAQKQGRLYQVGSGPFHAWIITKRHVIASPVTAATLRKRVQEATGRALEGNVAVLT